MLSNDLTLLISSCDKFSDLWELQVSLLEKNWQNRQITSYILTDRETERTFDNVKVVSAGGEAEYTERLVFLLKNLETEFVFFTLDDYLLIDSVEEGTIGRLVDIMKREKLDYMRLYKNPKSRKTVCLEKSSKVDLLSYDRRYDVNLYPGIWRTSVLLKAAQQERLNAWKFEISLTGFMSDGGYRSSRVRKNVFPILDSVRKGRFLHKAKRFIRRYGHYSGNRGTVPRKEEMKLSFMSGLNTVLPDSVRRFLKRLMKKRGMNFISDD